jgi:23S rRNA (cytosine1962-C5)-methyltransferase
VTAVLWKQRQNPAEAARNGRLIAGEALPSEIVENGISYALDLRLNQDAGFYPDTRDLRRWLADHLQGRHVLNCFAYTGSLGTAAGAGGAAEVVQTDLNPRFLALARRSWRLNKLPEDQHRLVVGDFFRVIGRMRHAGRLFDAVILDPPFFSKTDAGQVDLLSQSTRLINKVRPLVAHEGWLVVINNALFYSGAALMAELDALCQSAYVTFLERISVPEDVVGYPETRQDTLPVDPAPFNHATKIAVLRIFRKDKRRTGE